MNEDISSWSDQDIMLDCALNERDQFFMLRRNSALTPIFIGWKIGVAQDDVEAAARYIDISGALEKLKK